MDALVLINCAPPPPAAMAALSPERRCFGIVGNMFGAVGGACDIVKPVTYRQANSLRRHAQH
jgi:hypothetical protein